MKFKIERAQVGDISSIIELYAEVYEGKYPDPTFSDIYLLKEAIAKNFIVKALCEEQMVACLSISYDKTHRIAKAQAAVVRPLYRGHNLTQKLISFGIDTLSSNSYGLDVMYAITRTVNFSAQTLTERMGFKKLGIFPNVHKTDENETHALAAIFLNDSLNKRYTGFKQHPKVLSLYKLVEEELQLLEMESDENFDRKEFAKISEDLEVIDAFNFVNYRKEYLLKNDLIDLAFFPFHTPTHLITNKDQSNEVFCYINKIDRYCVITGIKIDRVVDLASILKRVSSILRDHQVRYVELLVRANRLNIIEKFIKAKFIPSGYFPGFQLEAGVRYDYVVFSKTFETLDFSNIEAKGRNKDYLNAYLQNWEEIYLQQSNSLSHIQ